MYRTPTASDTGEKSFEYAAKILNGKTVRKSNEKVQKTLSMDIAMEYLKDNPKDAWVFAASEEYFFEWKNVKSFFVAVVKSLISKILSFL